MVPHSCLLVLLTAVVVGQASEVNDTKVTANANKAVVEGSLSEGAKTPWCSLYDAVANNDLDSVCICLRQSHVADQLELKRGNNTPLMKAAQDGNSEIFEVLRKAGAVVDSDVLETLCENNRVALMRFLLDKGMDANLKVENGFTPLEYAAASGSLDIARMLLDRGADLNHKINLGAAAIHVASMKNHAEIVRLLLERGDDVNRAGAGSSTPLIWAAGNGSADVVRLLLEKGADSNLRSLNGDAAIHWAAVGNHTTVVLLLVEHGDINLRGEHGRTPLIAAAMTGSTEVARVLLEKGADRTLLNNVKNSALDLAMSKNHAAVVALLIGDDIDRRDVYGYTLLHKATLLGATDVVCLLLEKGADRSLRWTGFTALELAERNLLKKSQAEMKRIEALLS